MTYFVILWPFFVIKRLLFYQKAPFFDQKFSFFFINMFPFFTGRLHSEWHDTCTGHTWMMTGMMRVIRQTGNGPRPMHSDACSGTLPLPLPLRCGGGVGVGVGVGGCGFESVSVCVLLCESVCCVRESESGCLSWFVFVSCLCVGSCRFLC